MKVIFMGTPDFSVNALRALHRSGHEVAAVVTQPDREKGRGHAVSFSPVKEEALALGLPVYQPEKASEPGFIDNMKQLNADVAVVIAYGQILKKELLLAPKYGSINLHASLLPKYRGASPIQWAVINGDKKSGITAMQMDEGMDTGDILDVYECDLNAGETGGSLFDRLGEASGDFLLSVLEKLEAGELKRTKQDGEKATYVKKIQKSMGCVDWTMPAEKIECLVRGLDPWPGTYTFFDGQLLKLWKAQAVGKNTNEAPGMVLETGREGIAVQTGNGILVLKEVQLAGRKRMACAELLRGFDKIKPGTVFRGE